jgi:hypothetical protein
MLKYHTGEPLMKKILACAICLFAIASANSAFAAFSAGPRTLGTGVAGTGITAANNPTLIQQLSTNIEMDYIAAADGAGYIIGALHDKGTRTYGSSSGDAKIYWATITTSGTGIALPTTAPTGTASAAWTATTWTAQ